MDYKEILGIISALIAFGISVSYIYTIVKGRTRPHFYSIAIDAVISSIVLAGAFISGAGAGVWNLAVSTLFVYVMVLLCFKYCTKDVTKLDAVFALGAGLAIIPWFLTKDPTLSVVLASMIALLSMLPSARKTWNDPYSEPWTLWAMNALKHVIAIAAISILSVATLTYSVTMIFVAVAMVSIILYRRSIPRG